MRTIKRYPNRKLYDTREKRYVKLSEVAELVRRGEQVRVVDHTTGEDLTGPTLSQILFESRRRRGPLPKSFLEGIIQGGTKLREFLSRRLDHTLSAPGEAVLRRMGIPTRRELDTLRRRITQLERKLANLQAERPSSPPPR